MVRVVSEGKVIVVRPLPLVRPEPGDLPGRAGLGARSVCRGHGLLRAEYTTSGDAMVRQAEPTCSSSVAIGGDCGAWIFTSNSDCGLGWQRSWIGSERYRLRRN